MSGPRLTEEMEREVADALAMGTTVGACDVEDIRRPEDYADELNYSVCSDAPEVDYEVARFTLGFDADFYVAARNALPAYVAEVARLRSVLRTTVEALDVGVRLIGYEHRPACTCPHDTAVRNMDDALTTAKRALEGGAE